MRKKQDMFNYVGSEAVICWENWVYIQAADVLAPLVAAVILAFSE